LGKAHGVTERQLRELDGYRESDAFDEKERLVVELAEEMTKTPVDVPDALFDQLRSHFDAEQLVEIIGAIAWENYRARFNHAFGIEAEGFDEGAVCLLPVRTPKLEAT
jgi:alkylhydroperoxidase family enzyme